MTDPNIEQRLNALPDAVENDVIMELTADDGQWGFVVYERDLFPAIGKYITHIETGETKDTCKCEWLEVKGHFQRIAENLECPVHSKEGFLLGFFRWMFPDTEIAGAATEDDQPTVKLPKPATMMIHGLPEPADIIKDLPTVYTAPESGLYGVGNSGKPEDLSDVLKRRIEISGFRHAGD